MRAADIYSYHNYCVRIKNQRTQFLISKHFSSLATTSNSLQTFLINSYLFPFYEILKLCFLLQTIHCSFHFLLKLDRKSSERICKQSNNQSMPQVEQTLSFLYLKRNKEQLLDFPLKCTPAFHRPPNHTELKAVTPLPAGRRGSLQTEKSWPAWLSPSIGTLPKCGSGCH